mgnify:CR=1 FL=1
MTDHEKIEYIHSVLQESSNGHADLFMINTAIEFVEDMRETYFDKDGNTIRPNVKGYSTKGNKIIFEYEE